MHSRHRNTIQKSQNLFLKIHQFIDAEDLKIEETLCPAKNVVLVREAAKKKVIF